jgi:polar amino acid transport system substrate-binding protein
MLMTGGRLALVSSLLLGLVVHSAHAASCEPQRVAEKFPMHAGKVIKIAASPTQPPFSYSDPQNPDRMIGIEAEIIEKVMTCAGLKYSFVKGAWAALLPALYSGSADVMIGTVNYTPERGKRADFILYMRAGQSVVVPKGNPKHITGMNDLCGLIGSTDAVGTPAQLIKLESEKCTQRGKPAINFQPSVDTNASYRELLNGRVDFAMDDAPAAADRVKKEPGLELAVTLVTDILSGMVVPKGDKEMVQIVADGLEVEQQDGILAMLAKKYDIPQELLIPIQTRQ